MSKSSKKSKEKYHPPHLDELDDVEALFFLSEEEPVPRGKARRGAKRGQSVEKEPPKVLAVVSRKGGTGKTSIAMNLAEVLNTKRRRVVVLDLDRGADAVKWRDRGGGLTFTVERVDSRGDGKELKKSIGELSVEADLLILDTPPASSRVMTHAVQVADLVLIPTGASALDVRATVDVVQDTVEKGEGAKKTAPRVALVPSQLISRTRLAKELPKQLEELSLPVAPGIGQRVEVALAASEGRAVKPKSQAGLEFSKLARFVLRNLRQT
jgi:chromosome partitioning protein